MGSPSSQQSSLEPCPADPQSGRPATNAGSDPALALVPEKESSMDHDIDKGMTRSDGEIAKEPPQTKPSGRAEDTQNPNEHPLAGMITAANGEEGFLDGWVILSAETVLSMMNDYPSFNSVVVELNKVFAERDGTDCEQVFTLDCEALALASSIAYAVSGWDCGIDGPASTEEKVAKALKEGNCDMAALDLLRLDCVVLHGILIKTGTESDSIRNAAVAAEKALVSNKVADHIHFRLAFEECEKEFHLMDSAEARCLWAGRAVNFAHIRETLDAITNLNVVMAWNNPRWGWRSII